MNKNQVLYRQDYCWYHNNIKLWNRETREWYCPDCDQEEEDERIIQEGYK